MAGRKNIPVVTVNSPAGKRFIKTLDDARSKLNEEITARVASVIKEIRTRGDAALFEFTAKFDKYTLTNKNIRVSEKEISDQAKKTGPMLKRAIHEASKRIYNFHNKQVREEFSIRTAEAYMTQRIVPLKRVGVYIPGGHATYPSTVLMDVIPAKIAGVKEIVAITPPREELDPGIAYALFSCKVKEVYRIGGAQGIAALAYGTKSIKKVDKIVGPGNEYVATAKRLVFGAVDIDSVAGPSEVVILADDSANPEFVALDLLAQAEHGSGNETAICITEDEKFGRKVAEALAEEIAISPKRAVFEALPSHAVSILVTRSRDESIDLVNQIAPEHLQIITRDYKKDSERITNAAAIFMGQFTPVALGDYFIGTNHVLPTGGAARFASPLGVDSFIKRISVAESSLKGINIAAPYVSAFARAEKFVHHAMSIERRSDKGYLYENL